MQSLNFSVGGFTIQKKTTKSEEEKKKKPERRMHTCYGAVPSTFSFGISTAEQHVAGLADRADSAMPLVQGSYILPNEEVCA